MRIESFPENLGHDAAFKLFEFLVLRELADGKDVGKLTLSAEAAVNMTTLGLREGRTTYVHNIPVEVAIERAKPAAPPVESKKPLDTRTPATV